MKNKNAPGTAGTVRGAKGEQGDITKHLDLTPATSPAQAVTLTRQKRSKTFAAWVKTPAPHQLGLEPDAVARIARAMARPEMRGVSSLEGLLDGLKWLRVFYADDLACKRFVLAARYLWLTFKGKA